MHIVFFGLGSNLGDRKNTIERAIEKINSEIGTVIKQSSLYETEPWGFESSHGFINAAVCCDTKLSPFEILDVTQKIERELGRTQKSINGCYHDRTIDIDILMYDDIEIHDDRLTLPHPHMKERDFVMRPLSEIYDFNDRKM